MSSTVEARIRGEVKPVVWCCHVCLKTSATWPGLGLPREWVRFCDVVFCKRCAAKGRRHLKRTEGRGTK